MNSFKFLLRQGFPYASPENQMVFDLEDYRIINDILFFIMCSLMGNILKGIQLFFRLIGIPEFVLLERNYDRHICGTTKRVGGADKGHYGEVLHLRNIKEYVQSYFGQRSL